MTATTSHVCRYCVAYGPQARAACNGRDGYGLVANKPALTVWIPDPDADDLSAQLGDAYCAEYHGFDLRVEGNRWSVDSVEQFISGGYPGTPDWNEYHHGDGIASSPLEARWAAMRCAERTLVRDDAEGWLELADEMADPEANYPKWWIGATP